MHRDNDHIAIAYGMWWASSKVEQKKSNFVYKFEEGIDHSEIKGGSFVLGEYGIGVNFQKFVLMIEHSLHV
jgi:hypothetical protein